jgi:ribonuclease HI
LNYQVIDIYTDGSCNTVHNIGAWASIIFIDNNKFILKDVDQDTTHNRMELLAVIKAIDFIDKNYKHTSIVIYTDSQYVSRIPERKERLQQNHFLTKKRILLQNSDLVQLLIHQIETHTIEFVKVKAHQQPEKGCISSSINYNSEVDKIARQLVREEVKRFY